MSFHQIDGPGNLPLLEVCIDFTNNPTNGSRVWTDVTTDIRQISYTRAGRSDALQQTATGSLSAVLDNTSGNYDPSNTTGAYYPGVKRMRCIRVRAQWGGVTYNRFQGYVTSWALSWPGPGSDSICTITGVDALKVLALFDLGGKHYSAQRTDQRVSAICTDAGLPYSVFTGAANVVDSGTIATGTFALSHLQQVEDTEDGRLFADAGGTIVFQNRGYRSTYSTASSGTVGDHVAGGEIPYREASAVSDDANIWNNILVTPSGGTAQTASDSTSQSEHYTRTLSKSLLTSSGVDALATAQYLLEIYKEPSPKVPALQLIPSRSTAVWPTVLAATNGQRFTFFRRPSYGVLELLGFVEQVSDSISPGDAWDVSLQLADIDSSGGGTFTSFWVLQDSTYSVLGTTTALGY